MESAGRVSLFRAMTTRSAFGSGFVAFFALVISPGCKRGHAEPMTGVGIATRDGVTRAPPQPSPELCLGLPDKGIFPDLDPKVQIVLPSKLAPERVTATIDRKHAVVVLSIDAFPRKAYPLGGDTPLDVGTVHLTLRPGDRDELRPLLTTANTSEGVAAHDRDNDGIPDPLDVLIGAKKTVINADAYTEAAEGYIGMKYPNGDVPRTIGVCTDVIVRSVRNAGMDLQKELHVDIARAKAAYPMVKGAGDPSIDQRRVGTLLPFFKRHWEQHTAKLDDPADPLRPGDVIFMDTFPNRAGP